MCILLQFNRASTVSYQDLKAATSIQPESELKRHLVSLCTPKNRILLKGSKGKLVTGSCPARCSPPSCSHSRPLLLLLNSAHGVETGIASDDDSFTFNAAFKSKMKRVRVTLVAHKETDGSSTAVPAPVQEDRRHLIEAAIVRIMKTRKTLPHTNLIAAVIEQLKSRFMPSPQDIKKRVESLIEREYLERSRDRKQYDYLA